jgi:hypothetical protein
MNMENKLFWLHIKKCGGESFRKTLGKHYIQTDRIHHYKPFIALPRQEWNDALNNYRLPLGEYDYRRMQFARNFLYSEEEFSAMYKFTIVRNPYDRIVSAWKYLFGKNWRNVRRIRSNPLNLFRKMSFRYFLESLPEVWETKWDREIATHTAPAWADITDENDLPLLDRIYHLERIDECLDELNTRFGLGLSQMARVNVNRDASGQYRKYYNNRTRQLVEDYYGADISNFKYTF